MQQQNSNTGCKKKTSILSCGVNESYLSYFICMHKISQIWAKYTPFTLKESMHFFTPCRQGTHIVISLQNWKSLCTRILGSIILLFILIFVEQTLPSKLFGKKFAMMDTSIFNYRSWIILSIRRFIISSSSNFGGGGMGVTNINKKK